MVRFVEYAQRGRNIRKLPQIELGRLENILNLHLYLFGVGNTERGGESKFLLQLVTFFSKH